ncbi:MAG: CsgE family curli-type amyloid fiber assembly protein [Bacteroidota bacterium]
MKCLFNIVCAFFLVSLFGGVAVAQDSTLTQEYPAEIYIQQSDGDGILFVNVEPDLDEVLILRENNFRQIQLRFPDQQNSDMVSEEIQWEVADEENVNGEIIERSDSSGGQMENRLAEMLSEALRRSPADVSENRDVQAVVEDPDEEQLDEFREAFQAVLDEDNSTEEEPDQPDPAGLFEDIDGMVLDETRSKVGRDFYSAFFSAWEKPDDTRNYIIRIVERPGPSMASVVSVDVNYEKIFEMRLHPGDQRIKQAGDYAVDEVISYLEERKANPLTY